MEYFSIKNWEKHQHYKDRNPPWIKLHKDLLHDYEFTCLHDASKLQLMLIWLLASQMDNKIPCDQNWLKNTLHIEQEIDLKALSDGGFIEIDSKVLADCNQSAMPETETETDISSNSDESNNFDLFWQNYPRRENKKKAKVTFNRLCKTKQQLAIADCQTRYEDTQKQFIPLPTSYLNAERWEDEREINGTARPDDWV